MHIQVLRYTVYLDLDVFTPFPCMHEYVFVCLPARNKMTWSSRGSSEKCGILLAHSTKVKSCLSAAWQILVTGSLVWRENKE